MWDSGLYSVNYTLNKCCLASSQAGSIGRTTIQKVEAGQGEQENSGKQEAPSAILAQITEQATCELTAEKDTKP